MLKFVYKNMTEGLIYIKIAYLRCIQGIIAKRSKIGKTRWSLTTRCCKNLVELRKECFVMQSCSNTEEASLATKILLL